MLELNLTDVTPTLKTVLALGMEGAGKTHFISTFPKPILVYSFDQGYQTLAGLEGIKAKVFLEADRQFPTAQREFELELKKLLVNQEAPYKWPDGREEPYKTYALDPISFLSMYMMHQIQATNHTVNKKPTWDEYDMVLKKTTDLLQTMLNVVAKTGAYFVCTCHIKVDKDDDTGQMWFLADILGSSREKLGAWFDAVFYLKCEKKPTGERDYQLWSVGEKRERARLRLPASLSNVVKPVDVPDFSMLLKRLQDKGNSSTTTGGTK